jgi:chitinase
MNRFLLKTITLALFIAGLSSCSENKTEPAEKSPVIIAYVGGYRGEVDASRISPEKITHINYAFVNLIDGRATLTNEKTDTINFRTLNALKKDNPDLKILISIGGWTWSGLFSDAVLTEEGRKLFASTSADIVGKYDLDGVDIDWEYPGFGGMAGNIFRPEDKENFTLMFKSLRESLDSLSGVTGKKYLLTTAVGGFEKFVEHTEMDKCAPYLDYVNLMTYDYYPEGVARHHTNMYPSQHYECNYSGLYAVESFMRAGVPAEKLVVGISFGSRAFKVKDDALKGLGDSVIAQTRAGGGFTRIKDSLENRKGFVKYWDSTARAPYLFHEENKVFVTYDDEQSVTEKCIYTLENGLAGVMFWEYMSDPKEYLLDAINEAYGRNTPKEE